MPSVAVIGASSAKNKFGNKAVRAYLRQNWTVYPVNPVEKVIEGLTSYASISDIEGPIDRVSLYVPASGGRHAARRHQGEGPEGAVRQPRGGKRRADRARRSAGTRTDSSLFDRRYRRTTVNRATRTANNASVDGVPAPPESHAQPPVRPPGSAPAVPA